MKLFNWVHRKFRQNPTLDNRAVSDESIRGSVSELQPHDWYARGKTGREDRTPSSMRLATNGFEPAEAKSKKRVDASFHNIETVDVEREDLAFLVKEIQHGLLTIGTLGVDSIVAPDEDLKFFETMYVRFDSDVSPTEVLELELELEKVFYTQNENDDIADLHETKLVLIQEEEDDKDDRDTLKVEKRHEGISERKLLCGKKVYPLQEFLETPIEPSLIKKKKLSRSLSNLFSSRKDCGSPIKRSDERSYKENENAKPVLSSPSFLKAFFKSKRAQGAVTPHHKTKLDKLLRIFKKRHSFERSSDHQRSNGGVRGGVEEASDGRKEMMGGDDCCTEEEEITSDVSYLQEEDPLDDFETFRFEDWTDEYNQHPWWLRKDNLWMLRNENEYWIKTDEEYVVLEL